MSLDSCKFLVYAALAIALLVGTTVLSVWIERTKYVDCRNAGHSIVVCTARGVM